YPREWPDRASADGAAISAVAARAAAATRNFMRMANRFRGVRKYASGETSPPLRASRLRRGPAPEQLDDDQRHDRALVLVENLVPQARNAPVGLAAGGARFEQREPASQRVAGPHGREPTQFVDTDARDRALVEHPRLLHQRPRQRGGLESAADQS